MKKTILVLLISGWLTTGCETGNATRTDAVITVQDSIAGNYGALTNSSGVETVEVMYTTLQNTGSYNGKVIGEIKEVCQSKGCWMTMELPDGNKMRITFKDYGFFVPKRAVGYTAIIDGMASRTTTDVETLRHFAEDEGLPKEEVEKITAPKEEYTFEAEGVLIQEI